MVYRRRQLETGFDVGLITLQAGNSGPIIRHQTGQVTFSAGLLVDLSVVRAYW